MVFQIEQTVLLNFAVHAQGLPLSADNRIHDQTQLIDDPGTLEGSVKNTTLTGDAFALHGFHLGIDAFFAGTHGKNGLFQ